MFPSLYDPKDIGKLYTPRLAEFAAAGLAAGVKPAVDDTERVALNLIDFDIDFVFPVIGTLPVPGALGDVQRVIEFIYRNIEHITSIYATLDTHSLYQIFFPSWWRYLDNQQEAPSPFTMISLTKKGEVVDQNGRGLMDIIDPLWSQGTYLPGLQKSGKKVLTIWPYHCIEGTIGRALVPALAECFAYYSAARYSQIQYIAKAKATRTEQYGWCRAEIEDPTDPSTGWNSAVLDSIATHDQIYVAGEARSHCVDESMGQIVEYYGQSQPEVIRRIRFLDDCNSNVVVPGVDFESIVQAHLHDWKRQGIELRLSTDPIG